MTQSTSTSASLAAVLGVAEAERVRELVDERADLAVGGSGGDDDLPALGVAPAAGPVVGELTDLDARSRARGGVLEQRGDQVAVAVAVDRLCGGRERDGLDAGQRVGHRDVEDRHGAEEDALLARVLAVCRRAA